MMEDNLIFQKTLHLLIDQFIQECDHYIQTKKLQKSKIFVELMKRCPTLSQNIRAVALSLSAKPFSTNNIDVIKGKASDFFAECLQQDLVECALIADPVDLSLSNDELHNIIFKSCLQDPTSITPFLMRFLTDGNPVTEMPLYNPSVMHLPQLNDLNASKIVDVGLSNKFLNPYNESETEFSLSRNAFDAEVPHIPLGLHHIKNNFDLNGSENLSNDPSALKSELESNKMDDWLLSVIDSKQTGTNPLHDVPLNRLSWEGGKMGQNVPCHLYTTELTDDEFFGNVISEDSELFRVLNNPTGVVSDADMIHDLLDLLIGIPSSTFKYDEKKKTFQLKPFAHLTKRSYESTLRFCEKFVECGTVYYKLKEFKDSLSPKEGCTIKGLKSGVHEILSAYEEYIAAVKEKKLSLNVLKIDVWENVQLINAVGRICGISYQESSSRELPKGLGLLSFLNKIWWSYKTKGLALIISVLLKFAYAPYFNFLNKWMAEGFFDDPHNEFQIEEDMEYAQRTDYSFWEKAYTENEADELRKVPVEIENFSPNILQCGKTIRLFRNCSIRLKSLEYQDCRPPPSPALLFSYEAIDSLSEECESYVAAIDSFHLNTESCSTHPSEEDEYIRKQSLLQHSTLVQQMEKRWNWFQALKDSSTQLHQEKCKTGSLRRCKSMQTLDIDNSDIFSGAVINDVGILFSVSGYSSTQSATAMKMKRKFHHLFNWALDRKSNPDFNLMSSSGRHDQIPMRKTGELKTERDENIRSRLYRGTFIDRLLALLVSKYGDSKESIYSYIQMTSVQSLLQYNITPILEMRRHLVQSDFRDHVINKLKDLLACLKNIYFLQDESFSQSFCKKLFERTQNCKSLETFTNRAILKDILLRSVSRSSLANVPFLDSATVNIQPLKHSTSGSICANKFMHSFNFEFVIDRPLNIIIRETCISSQYSEIFSLILEMEYLCWLLGKVWRTSFIDTQGKILQNSPQYRIVMLQRFDMHQFVRILHNSIHQDLGGPLWESLEQRLSSKELNFDVLGEIHHKYIEDALERCFLTENTRCAFDKINPLFDEVYKFCGASLACTWDFNPVTNFCECSNFDNLAHFYAMYVERKRSFYNLMFKMVSSMEHKKNWNVPFKQYLKAILETGRRK